MLESCKIRLKKPIQAVSGTPNRHNYSILLLLSLSLVGVRCLKAARLSIRRQPAEAALWQTAVLSETSYLSSFVSETYISQ